MQTNLIRVVSSLKNEMITNRNQNSRNILWFWKHLFDFSIEKIETRFNWVKYFHLYFMALKLKKVIKVI